MLGWFDVANVQEYRLIFLLCIIQYWHNTTLEHLVCHGLPPCPCERDTSAWVCMFIGSLLFTLGSILNLMKEPKNAQHEWKDEGVNFAPTIVNISCFKQVSTYRAYIRAIGFRVLLKQVLGESCVNGLMSISCCKFKECMALVATKFGSSFTSKQLGPDKEATRSSTFRSWIQHTWASTSQLTK